MYLSYVAEIYRLNTCPSVLWAWTIRNSEACGELAIQIWSLLSFCDAFE